MAKYVTLGQLKGQLDTMFRSLKAYLDDTLTAPVKSLAQQAKALADEVVRRADAGEFKGEKGEPGSREIRLTLDDPLRPGADYYPGESDESLSLHLPDNGATGERIRVCGIAKAGIEYDGNVKFGVELAEYAGAYDLHCIPDRDGAWIILAMTEPGEGRSE